MLLQIFGSVVLNQNGPQITGNGQMGQRTTISIGSLQHQITLEVQFAFLCLENMGLNGMMVTAKTSFPSFAKRSSFNRTLIYRIKVYWHLIRCLNFSVTY